MTNVVYVVQDDGSKNLLSARRYGKLVPVAHRNYPLFADPKDHIDRMCRALENYDPARDYVMLIGDPVNIGLVVAATLRKGGGKYLKWDRQTEAYKIISLNEMHLAE